MADPNRLTRRGFLGGVAAAGALGALPPGMADALAGPRVSGSLADVEHVVVLMQENRSFDHYYGTMKGIRGYGDRSAIVRPNGQDVFHQPDSGRGDGKYLLPFRADTTKVDGQDLGDLGHYDENDGFFDHVAPPIAPSGTAGEYIGGKPIGLGARVPMTVISPWSRGGWISSEVTDHTSVIRFLERWTGVAEPNISAWRRAVCGDLMTCFDFGTPNVQIPLLPDTAALRKQADDTQRKLPKPAPPATGKQQVPVQEAGTRRPARSRTARW